MVVKAVSGGRFQANAKQFLAPHVARAFSGEFNRSSSYISKYIVSRRTKDDRGLPVRCAPATFQSDFAAPAWEKTT